MTGSDHARLLYVDDERDNLEVFVELFRSGAEVFTADSAEAALEILEREPIEVLLTDQRMPHVSGNALIKLVADRWPTVVAVVVTAYADLELVLGAIRAGRIHDYIIKPWQLEILRDVVASAVAEARRRNRLARAAEDVALLQEEVRRSYDPNQIVGDHPTLRDLVRQAQIAGRTDSTVLILGETGTGKELLARAVHAASARAERPLVKVDCSALAPTLFETELFGHAKGAFTGAVGHRPGRLEQAQHGTVFLDEVGDVPLDIQPRLLRLLQDHVLERPGADRPIPIDVRVIAATRRDLAADVRKGRFREDLLYRLAVVPLRIPPLRDRPGDIPALVRHLLHKRAPGISSRFEVTPEALDGLAAHDWPGNVRELENLIERAVALELGPVLGPDELAPFVRGVPPGDAASLEAERIREALDASGGSVRGAAARLRMPRGTLMYRIRKLGIR
jgi:DNA-binding NtrC family response regulator